MSLLRSIVYDQPRLGANGMSSHTCTVHLPTVVSTSSPLFIRVYNIIHAGLNITAKMAKYKTLSITEDAAQQ